MKTSIKTLKGYLDYIKNTFTTSYHNGYVEGNNNFIKVLKGITFGLRSFTRLWGPSPNAAAIDGSVKYRVSLVRKDTLFSSI